MHSLNLVGCFSHLSPSLDLRKRKRQRHLEPRMLREQTATLQARLLCQNPCPLSPVCLGTTSVSWLLLSPPFLLVPPPFFQTFRDVAHPEGLPHSGTLSCRLTPASPLLHASFLSFLVRCASTRRESYSVTLFLYQKIICTPSSGNGPLPGGLCK